MSIKNNNVDVDKIGSWQEVFERTCSDRVKKAIDRAVRTPEICLEHAEAEMKVYEATKGEPRIIQRAKVFEQYLKDRTIFILDGELIVGNVNSSIRGATIVGELYNVFLENELDDPIKDFQTRDFDKHIVTPEQRKELREVIFPYFKGKTLEEHLMSIASDDVKEKSFVTTSSCPHIPNFCDLMVRQDAGHMLANYEKVLYKGLKGIKEELLMYMEENEKPYMHFDKKSKREFYQAALITLDAAIDHAQRYSDLSRDMAKKETNPKRKAELEKIAEICAHVPANPARNWQEALQSVWMLQVLILCEQINYADSFGRFDQYMYPFYEKSIQNNEITREEALELLELWFVKTAEFTELYDFDVAKAQIGFPISQNLLIGGQTSDGKDACNEVTMLCLEAEEQVGLIQPEIALRLWEGTPEKYLRKAAEVVRLGRGKPKFYSDKTAILQQQKAYPDLTIEDWRNYAVIGCVEIALPHITMQYSFTALTNAPKIVELVLNNGKCGVCGKQIGPTTGDPTTFESFENFKQAYVAQSQYWMEYMGRGVKVEMDAQAHMMQVPFCSTLIEGPLQKGKDIINGGAWYSSYGLFIGGAATAGDSLAAIDDLIYRKKRVTLDELQAAIKDNWEGHDELRQMVKNEAPKYGNDIDNADDYTTFVLNTWYDGVDWLNKNNDLLPAVGGRYRGAILIGNGAVGMGAQVAASADGRKHPDAISDTLSPVQGVDVNGTTAVLKSVSKMPAHRYEMGTALNQRLSPQMLETDRDIDNFVAYLRTMEELGVYHAQFNIITSKVLRQAMKEPEKYKDLLVRVASYVSYFVELDTETKIDIINRTEHNSW